MELNLTPPKKKLGLIDMYFKKLHSLRTSDAFILKVVLLSLAVFLALFVIQYSYEKSVDVASTGGVFSEGILGTPRFVNPVLAVTRADKDLTDLVYNGLMKLGPDGTLKPNMAESVTISDDGLTYNIVLKQGLRFHDGNDLTAEDVVYTVLLIQDPLLKSPLRANFDGVVVEEAGSHEINFILPEAYAPFIENLTFGILPRHIWKDASVEEFPFSQHNTDAVGSGPYMVEKITRNSSGLPEKYILRSNPHYHRGAPKIEVLQFTFFPTEDELISALNEGKIESVVGLSVEKLDEIQIDTSTTQVVEIPLPRTFAAFINQNRVPALRDETARQALSAVLNREHLVETVLNGFGTPLQGPVPPGFGIDIQSGTTSQTTLDEAKEMLRDAGWEVNDETGIWEKEIDDVVTPLSFSISTVNSGIFEETAEFLRTAWTELGAEVSVKQFELSDLKQAVIRPRDYQILLFGTELGRSLDFYSFWHSSQKDDPGLNIALYTNITTDSILSELRRNNSLESKEETLISFIEEIDSETPAIFLYAPKLIYIFPTRIENTNFTGVAEPHERFASIYNWHTETESVWPLFTQ